MLNIFDTLTKSIKPLETTDPINLYTCGPTVYGHAHIGNFRSYIFADILQKTLKYGGNHLNWVMNLTDIDDKTIAGTLSKYGPEAGVNELKQYTNVYTEDFKTSLPKFGIQTTDIKFVSVVEHIPEIIQFIENLLDKGYGYTADDGSTYFSIEKYQTDFGDYGLLVGKEFIAGKKVGARVKVDEYDKDNLSDFALWKAHSPTDGNIFWESKSLGRGRPGWHIECSVINHIAFGGPTDIHTGGVDLIFPHHTNEIAQSQPFYKPFTRSWAHCEHLMVDGKKMAKSDGNTYKLEDLEKKLGPNAGYIFRYLTLQTNYGTQMNFTWESAVSAKTALHSLQKYILSNQGTVNETWKSKFTKALEENLNTAKALAITHDLLNDPSLSAEDKSVTLLDFDQVLGLGLNQTPLHSGFVPTAEMQQLIKQRDTARTNKDFAKSDELREELTKLGVEVQDTSEGTKITPKL